MIQLNNVRIGALVSLRSWNHRLLAPLFSACVPATSSTIRAQNLYATFTIHFSQHYYTNSQLFERNSNTCTSDEVSRVFLILDLQVCQLRIVVKYALRQPAERVFIQIPVSPIQNKLYSNETISRCNICNFQTHRLIRAVAPSNMFGGRDVSC